jgi:hypothetical protein
MTMQRTYAVQAHWDDEATVWFSSSDILGLVVEADSLAEFERLVVELAPALLAENEGLHDTNVVVTLAVDARRLDLAVA